MNGVPSDLATRILRRHQHAKERQNAWLGVWRDSATYVKPDRDCLGPDGKNAMTPNTGVFDLFDGTAMTGNLIYAAGCMAYLTPADQPWFKFDAPQFAADDEAVKSWCSEVTEITQQAIARSNFYSQIHESYLEDGAFGTQSLFCEAGDKNPLRFTSREIGDYAMLENADGEIDTWFHESKLTARQAVQKFSRPGDELPDTITEQIEAGGNKADTEHRFLHVIYPREDAERDNLKIDGPNMPWASVYLHLQTKQVVRVSGYWEAPEATGRYMRWGKNVFGIAPFLFGLADQRQLNDLQMNMDVLAEVAAFPRILAHSDLEGEIDLRRSGVTYFGDQSKKAEEWLTGGRYDIGLDRIRERQEAVKRAFHVELFQLFAGIPPNKEMTAYEVAQRKEEKLQMFSPTFARKTKELLNPMLRRVFGILIRNGAYPEIPEALVQPSPQGIVVVDPEITYTSRIALELKALQSAQFQKTLAEFAPIAELRPDIFDNVNFDAAFRDTLRNGGVAENWIMNEQERDQLRQMRAQAEMEARQKEEMMAGMEAAGKAAQAGLIPSAA